MRLTSLSSVGFPSLLNAANESFWTPEIEVSVAMWYDGFEIWELKLRISDCIKSQVDNQVFTLNEDICAEASKYVKDGGHIWGREGSHMVLTKEIVNLQSFYKTTQETFIDNNS